MQLNSIQLYFYFLFNVNLLTQGLKTPGVLFLTPGTTGSMGHVTTLGLCPSLWPALLPGGESVSLRQALPTRPSTPHFWSSEQQGTQENTAPAFPSLSTSPFQDGVAREWAHVNDLPFWTVGKGISQRKRFRAEKTAEHVHLMVNFKHVKSLCTSGGRGKPTKKDELQWL